MTPTGLVVDDLHRSFGDVHALAGVSLHVRPGSLHGFVGANGAGKTTTMRIIVGVDEADRGTVSIGARPITQAQRARIGYLPEERGLYPEMRVAEQVAYLARLHGLDATDARSRAEGLLTRLGLADRVGSKTEELSLGNQQRVQLAAALVHDPDLLVLDEPFSGLDPVASDVMAELLRERADRGVPVLFSSHQLELVERLCDHVTIIADGRQVADGGIEQLRSARAERRVRIVLDAPHPDWAAMPDVAAVEVEGRTAVITLVDGVDDQQLLDRARRAGRVEVFTPVVPSLAELYREVTA